MNWNPITHPYRCTWTGYSTRSRVETFTTYGEAAHAAARMFTARSRESTVQIDKAEHAEMWQQNGSWRKLGTRKRNRPLVLTVQGRREHEEARRCACGNLAVAADVLGEYHDELCQVCAHALYIKIGAES